MDKVFRVAVAGLPMIVVVSLIVLGRSLPQYFNSLQYLAGFIFLEILLLSLWFYDLLFFPLLMIAFLWAGMNIPLTQSWTTGRWVVLGVGTAVGLVRALRMGLLQRFHPLHLVAALCVISAMASAMMSAGLQLSLMKAFSLFLLFLYAASGGRLVLQNPDRFFRGLLLACEISVYASAVAYALGLEIWGNANSLGAVEGVIAAPLLLWGALVAPAKNLRLRRAISCLVSLYLVYFSV